MAYICDNCEKGIVHGSQSTHGRGVAGKRWKKRAQKTSRLFKPNLQKIAVVVDGKQVQMRLCASCISRFVKDGKIKNLKKSSVASI